MKHFLITGTGRCGTTYCTNVLRACGINCGHQAVFNHEGVLAETWDWGEYDGDSSYEAVPLLPLLCRKEPSVRVVLLKRNMNDVIASWQRLGMFGDDMYQKFIYLSQVLDKHFPTVLQQQTPDSRGTAFYHCWMARAKRYANAVIDVDKGLTPKKLLRALNLRKYYNAKAEFVPKNTNTSVGKNA